MAAEPNSDFDFLATFAGEPGQFWPRYRAHAQQVMAAAGACVLIQLPGQTVRVLSQDSAKNARAIADSGLVGQLDGMSDGGLHAWTDGMSVAGLPSDGGPRLWLVFFDIACAKPAEVLRELRLLAESYQGRRREQRSSAQVEELNEVLDLGLNLGESADFQNAALRLCHRLASQMKATRVSLAWLETAGLRVVATSHGGRVNPDSHEAERMVRTMEESLDQNNEVAHPPIAGSQAISREHKMFSEQHGGGAILSVPLRDAVRGEVVGVLMLEREMGDVVWSALEAEHLRVAADLITSRLVSLHEACGWLGRRVWRSLRRKLVGWLGAEHTGWKFASLLIFSTILLLALIRMEHKVRSPFLLKTDAAAIATAPFPGFIDEVRYHLGDVVKKGQVLVTLDRRELLLEEANVIAARDKSDREARAYEAEGRIAESLMAKAVTRQEDAKLGIVRHRLAMTEVRAPFDGIVVEGDLRERLSSPVQSGEQLFKVVQIRDLVGELQVDERDIGYLREGQDGELAFASRPGDRFEVRIMHYEPVAEVREKGNVFKLRVQVMGEPQAWWRPGMSGVCKVNAGKASLLWIFSHRTIETIRLWLWL